MTDIAPCTSLARDGHEVIDLAVGRLEHDELR